MSTPENQNQGAEEAAVAVKERPGAKPSPPKQPRAWNVVLLNDEEHTYEYVIHMMQKLFGHSKEKAFQIAKTVDSDDRAVCLTTHKEHAELKMEQIHGFGRDPWMSISKGSMSAVIEPAEFGGEDGGDGGKRGDQGDGR